MNNGFFGFPAKIYDITSDITTITISGVYRIPADAKLVRIVACGGGGGGGGGSKKAAGSAATGGGGGAGGNLVELYLLASDIGIPNGLLSIIIGSGGAGAGGATADGFNGLTGSDGSYTTVSILGRRGTMISAGGGKAGRGGNPTSGDGGIVGYWMWPQNVYAQTNGTAGGSSFPTFGTANRTNDITGTGGAGGGVATATNTSTAGASISAILDAGRGAYYALPTGGARGTSGNGGNGQDSTNLNIIGLYFPNAESVSFMPAYGGGGGGGATLGNGGIGGNGFRGSGGGGGGGARNTYSGGTGGNGGNGYVTIAVYR